ncbi:MAG TPA: family 16 glycoside hydrolase, partial [Opitutales bacterium]|nr:family 16 glycoside hydrolase [Opitutales bacterium]
EKLSDGIPEIDLTEWNDYRIVAKGDTVTHWLNGSLATKIVDHEVGKFSRKGAIGLQLHAGAPMKAEFKDIVLRKISGNEETPALREEASAAPIPEWIWSRESAKTNEQIYLRRTVTVPEKILGATLLASGDDFFELSINGNKVGESSDWKTPSFFDVSGLFQNGDDFQIAVRAQNESGPAGFVFKLELYLEDGGRKIIVSDENWEWSASDTDDSDWQKVVSVGEMGSGPWGDIFAGYAEIGLQTAEDVSADYQLLPGFKLERVYEVPKFQGSWVALTIDDRGRLIASDQYGGLFRITPPPLDDPLIPTKVEQLPVQIKGAQGLLWTEDALFASVSVGDMGIYQITDSNGDGEYDRIDRIVELFGRGEHGPHGFTLSPDGKWIYVTAGNHTLPPQVDASLVPEVWDEDQLLPRRPDARGHARNVKAPGGWIARFTPDGKHWELVSIGFRNTYAIAFDEHGELFTYDSDMEWDFGTPWYRPTRINHVTSGSEFGWRHGTGKWPAYYEDSLPAILDIGPGSPTGVVSGAGLAFPERYQRALYMLDWTYATLYAVHLTPNGASYRAETEELVAGSGLPMTDAIVGADGALYFTTGGRRLNSALYRVIYTGNEATDRISGPKPLDPETTNFTNLRHELESLHENPDPAALDQIWSALDHEDRFIRFAARTALEHLPPEIWKNRFTNENSPWQTIQAAIAITRTGEGSDQSLALDALEAISWTALDEPQKLNLLRAFGLSFARHGNPDDARRERLIEEFEAHFPAETDFLNRELVRMLVYLESPEVLAKTLRLMAAHNEGKAPQWA